MSDLFGDKNLGFTPERYPAGTHVCMMYNDEAERREVVHPFVLAGLQDGESVYYMADTLPSEWVRRALDERAAATLSGFQLSRLHVSSAFETYCPSGVFIANDMIARQRAFYESSRSDGSSGCRAAGETSWLSSDIPGFEDFVLYESSINSLLATTPMTVLCQYDTELLDGMTLFELLSVHPLMVIHGQVLRNPYYIEPAEFLAALHDPDVLKRSKSVDVIGELLLVELVLTGLPDDLRMVEFVRGALMRIPGVRDTHVVLTNSIIPPDDRWESIRQRCLEAADVPGSLDMTAIRSETSATIFLMRSTSRLFGVVIVEVDDAESFARYQDFVFNIVNAVVIAQDSWRDRVESRSSSERVANLEQRLWRISHELKGVGITMGSAGVFDLYARPGVNDLSQRQLVVLTRLLQGDRVANIADALFVSQSAVRNHLSQLFRKFGVRSQQELLDLFRSDRPDEARREG